MSLLGVILGGGRARRFGSDKAEAPIDGIPMLDRIAERLRPQVDALVVAGRVWPGLESVADHPRPGLGPLGGLCGALFHAARAGHEGVLATGCDLPDLPLDLRDRLGSGPAVIEGQPLLGSWPVGLAEALLLRLSIGDDRSMRGWIAAAGARTVSPETPLANLNTAADYEAFLRR